MLASLIPVAVGACTLSVSERSEFDRDVPLPDAGPCSSQAVVWRATSVVVEKPEGLVAFQTLLTQAANSDNLNFMIAQSGPDLDFDAPMWPLRMGDGEPGAGGCYAFSTGYPAAETSVTVNAAGGATSFSTEGTPVEDPDSDPQFVVVARLPFAVPLPLRVAQVSAEVSSDRQSLEQGRVEAVILGEVAAVTFLDLQSDGDPANDQPLSNFLGDPDIDHDGDMIVDDYAAVFEFTSARVGIDE